MFLLLEVQEYEQKCHEEGMSLVYIAQVLFLTKRSWSLCMQPGMEARNEVASQVRNMGLEGSCQSAKASCRDL